MNKPSLWEKLKNIIESCNTHEQLNVARKLIDRAAYDLMSNRKKGPYNQDDGYYNDLSCRITNKRRLLYDIEDKKLLEKWDAKDKDFKKSSERSIASLCNE